MTEKWRAYAFEVPNQKLRNLILFVFLLVFCSISIVNHYNFRTTAIDLGSVNQALYNFSQFKANYFTLDIRALEINYFADHFSPITLLMVPLYYVFGSYTMLLVQIVSVLFAALGVYRYAYIKLKDRLKSTALMTLFLGIWGIYSALSFDYHSNVFAAMLVPWLFVYFEEKRIAAFIILTLLIAMCKENMPLWLTFIVTGIVLNSWKKLGTSERWIYTFIAVGAFVYFILVMMVFMPYFSGGIKVGQMARFNHLGASVPEIISTIVQRPAYVFSLLYESSTEGAMYKDIKWELHQMVFLSGGLFLLYRPAYLIMLVPIYAQKMLSNDYSLWGINGQYSIEYAPILAICCVDSMSSIRYKLQWPLILLLVITTYGATMSKLDYRVAPWYSSVRLQFYKEWHYKSGLHLDEIYEALKLIPDDVSLSASANLAAHLARRDKLYHFPIVKNAEYIALFKQGREAYPLSDEGLTEEIEKLRLSNEYEVLKEGEEIIIFRKTQQ